MRKIIPVVSMLLVFSAFLLTGCEKAEVEHLETNPVSLKETVSTESTMLSSKLKARQALNEIQMFKAPVTASNGNYSCIYFESSSGVMYYSTYPLGSGKEAPFVLYTENGTPRNIYIENNLETNEEKIQWLSEYYWSLVF